MQLRHRKKNTVKVTTYFRVGEKFVKFLMSYDTHLSSQTAVVMVISSELKMLEGYMW